MPGQKRILLVEDEPHLAYNLKLNFKAEGYEVAHAHDGQEAIAIFDRSSSFSAIVLDIMLPEVNGFEVAKHIRKRDHSVGILMLTARAADSDRLRGLEIGADDYVTKPFSLSELLARVRRMTERSTYFAIGCENKPIQQGPFLLYVAECKLNREGLQSETIDLTSLEADVLREFFCNPNIVLSRDHLLTHVWGISSQVETRTVDNFIARLRKYLEPDSTHPRYLVSVRGRGYKFVTDTPVTYAPASLSKAEARSPHASDV